MFDCVLISFTIILMYLMDKILWFESLGKIEFFGSYKLGLFRILII